MYLTKVTKIEGGVELAKDIYTSDDRVLLRKGTELTEEYIERLKRLGINYVYINDQKLNDVQINEIVAENIKREAVILAKECLENVRDNKNQQRYGLIQSEKIINLVDDIIDDIAGTEDLIINLKDVRKLEDELFFHLVNVAIFSLIVGDSLDYDKDKMKLLGIGAFLHDIGKAKVSKKILNKPGELTDEEYREVQKHTIYGYEILRGYNKIDNLSALIAYQHHERYDGSGYPEGIKGKTIHEFGRIVAIADVFDAMRSTRVYRPAFKIKEVVEYLYTMITKRELDHELMEEFLQHLTLYPKGSKVRLNNGYEGVVIKARKHANSRPVVRILKQDGKELDPPKDIDLNRRVNLVIEETL